MNLRQLRYFCEVVEAGSARAAAEKLFVAPTAISMQLAQLEDTLGGRLFDRGSRPMALTPLGQFVYPKAKELLSNASRMAEEAKGIASGNLGWLSIGFTRSVIFSVLPAAVRSMQAAFPNVRIDLDEVLTGPQAEALRNGSIHVGIARVITPVVEAPDLAYTHLFDDPLIAALPLQHPLAAGEAIDVAAFDASPFISYPKDPTSRFGAQALAALESAGAHPRVGYEAKEIHTALGLVAAGLGITVVGRSVAAHNRTDIRFLPVRGLQANTRVFAVRLREEPNRLADAFLEILKKQVAETSGDTPGPAAPATAPART